MTRDNHYDNGEYIPGTEYIFADKDQPANGEGLKHDGEVLLIPQPSDSPNDPLNWSSWRKWLHFLILMFITAFTAATSNDAGATQDQIHQDLGISWSSMNTAAGVLFIGIGYFTLLLSPTAFLYGRKIGYMICILVGMMGAVWFGLTKTTSDSVWNQLFVGASEACAEAQVQLSLSDIYFQHQLGSKLGYYIMATSTGTYIGPLIAGYVSDRLDWQWVPWIAVIVSGGLLVVMFFMLEETYFDRAAFIQCQEPDASQTSSLSDAHDKVVICGGGCGGGGERVTSIKEETPQGYWKSVALITKASNLVGTGFRQYVDRLWLTLRVFTFPPVLYSGLQWGAQDAWLTFYMTTQDETWSLPPRNYSSDAIALMNVPTLIGALIGCFYGGTLSDWFVLYMAKRNGGWKEPETRLWLMFGTAIISPLGLLIFGLGTHYQWSITVAGVGLVLTGFGFGCAGDLSMAYLMDCYPEMVLEGMVGVSVINNTLSCIFTFACSPWIYAQGVKNTYIAISCLSFFFLMLTAPMIYYGKRCRIWSRDMYKRFLDARDGFQ